MKRGIAIILALAMTLSLEGCKRQTVWTAQLPSDAKHKASRGLETSCNPRIASDAEYTYVINYNDGVHLGVEKGKETCRSDPAIAG